MREWGGQSRVEVEWEEITCMREEGGRVGHRLVGASARGEWWRRDGVWGMGTEKVRWRVGREGFGGWVTCRLVWWLWERMLQRW
jgi:hypothetical protein